MLNNKKEDFKILKSILNILGFFCKKTYKYKDSDIPYWKYLYHFIYQKFLLFNFQVPWPVHYTSYLSNISKIKFGKNCSPGSSPFNYINASSGLVMGDNVKLGPGVVISTENHNPNDYDKYIPNKPLHIGSNVWIGAHSVILPGITIGNNVIIGAGSIVTKDIPSNSIAVGNPCRVIKKKMPYKKNK